MHTVELLEQAQGVAEELGYRLRHEWMGGNGGGACEFGGKKWIFVDLALSTLEQLHQVAQALRSDAAIYLIQLSPEMQSLLDMRRAA